MFKQYKQVYQFQQYSIAITITDSSKNTRLTWFMSSERTFSKTPNGRATDVGTPTQEGTFPFRNEIFRDLAPT